MNVVASGPARYAAGQPNPSSLTITNHGAALEILVGETTPGQAMPQTTPLNSTSQSATARTT